MAISVKESTDSLGYKTQTVYNGAVKVHEIRYNPDGKERYRTEYTSEGVKQKETRYDYDENTTTIDLFDEKGEIKSSEKREIKSSEKSDSTTGKLLEEKHYTNGRMTSRLLLNDGKENLKLKTNTEGYDIEVDDSHYLEKYEDEYDPEKRTSLIWHSIDDRNESYASEVFFDTHGNVTRMEEGDDYGTRTLHFNRQQVKETNSRFEDEDRRLAVINGDLKVVEINSKNGKNQPVTEEFGYDQDNYLTSHKVQDFDENGNKRESITHYNAKESPETVSISDIEDLERQTSWTRETLVNGVLRERTHNDFLKGDDERHRVVTTRYDENGEISSITSTTSQNDSLTNVKRDAVVEYDPNKDFYEFNLYQKKGDQIVYRKIPYEAREKGVWHSSERDRNVLNNPFSHIKDPFEGNFNKEIIEIKGKGEDVKRTAFDADGNYTVTTYPAFLRDYLQNYGYLPEYFSYLDKIPYKSEEKYDLHNNLVSRKIRNEENNEEIIFHYENNKLVSRTTLKNDKEEKIEYNEMGLPMSQISNQGETTIKKTFDNRGLVSTEVKDENGRIVEDAKGNATYYDQNGNKINPKPSEEKTNEQELLTQTSSGKEEISQAKANTMQTAENKHLHYAGYDEMQNTAQPELLTQTSSGKEEISRAEANVLGILRNNGSHVHSSDEEMQKQQENKKSLNGRE